MWECYWGKMGVSYLLRKFLSSNWWISEWLQLLMSLSCVSCCHFCYEPCLVFFLSSRAPKEGNVLSIRCVFVCMSLLSDMPKSFVLQTRSWGRNGSCLVECMNYLCLLFLTGLLYVWASMNSMASLMTGAQNLILSFLVTGFSSVGVQMTFGYG